MKIRKVLTLMDRPRIPAAGKALTDIYVAFRQTMPLNTLIHQIAIKMSDYYRSINA